jgi:hypothetical protein
MSCFCLGPKGVTEKEATLNQTHVGDFFRVALGDTDLDSLGDVSNQCSDSKLNEFSRIDVGPSRALSELAALNPKSRVANVVRQLSPLVIDYIRRKASLAPISQALSNTGIKDLQGITPRDLFVGVALCCSDTVRLYSLASLIPGMGLPLVVPGPGSREPMVLWDAFSDLLSVPRGPLIVSIGTDFSRGSGKTALLRGVGLCGVTKPYDILGGKTGYPSVDVYFPGSVAKSSSTDEATDVVIADCSGLSLIDPTISSLLSGAALTLVHVYPKDVSDKSGPSRELKELLGSGKSRMIIVLIRDAESWKPQCRGMLEACIDAFKTNIATTIEVPNYLKSVVDRMTIYRTVYNNMQKVWSKSVKGCMCPSISVLRKGGPEVSPSKSTLSLISSTARELWQILQEEHSSPGSRISTKLFPFSTANTRLLQLKRDERRVREEGNADCEQALTMIAKERGSWNAFLSNSQPSRAIQWFCNLINSTMRSGNDWKLTRLTFEINEVLELWKRPLMEPLMKQKRELMDAGDLKSAQEVFSQIEELNISMDSFWTELEVLTSPESPWEQATALEADIELIHQAYAFSILAGAPIQLLKGTPLRLTDTAFLKTILGSTGGSSSLDQQILVVSVIGAQSSAKSTLLNFLFGSNFVTRAGRCTRGLYASFLRLEDGRLLVVLDTEGLLSIESNPGEQGDVFDGQMTLLAMACSQLVLINHKGEVSRQLQDLLEVCMFALKHLRVTNFQPDIFFVLRDQHDRSPTVHEDMLRHMKRHLSGCASRLGLKMEDVLRLNASSIHLLPSAYVSQVDPMSGKEIATVNETFPEEVLKLRASILKVLQETVSRQSDTDSGRMGAWHSLEQWYTHCNTVWETLVQFGHNLLHYKTIREIEVKRELAQIGSDISRHVLENGFKPEGSKLLHAYIDQYLSAPSNSLERLDQADVEFRSAIGSLRTAWETKLGEAFEAQTSNQERFTVAMKEEVSKKLPAILEYVFDNLMYTWKLHLKQAKDASQSASMWAHFCSLLDKLLFADPTKMAVVSETEARSLFAKEWTRFESEFIGRLEAVRKQRPAIAYEVSALFNSALSKAVLERPDYQLLKETGPQTLLNPTNLMNDEPDDMWRLKYLSSSLGGGDDVSRDIRSLRKMTLDLCSDIESEIERSNGLPSETIVVEWFRNAHEIAYRDAERRMKVSKVRQPQVLAALHADLRLTSFNALCKEEDAKHEEQLQNLLKQKHEVEEHVVLMAKGNAGDVERAASFADRYHKQIDEWLDRQVTAFASEVRATVLAEMPDPAKAHERAFQQSFGARNWMDVLEYCLDVNAYLEKMFLTLFYRRQAAVTATRLPLLEQKVRDMYAHLRERVSEWYKLVSDSIVKGKSSSLGMYGGSGKRIYDFRKFVTDHGGEVAMIFPPTVNFEIRDVRIFSEAFREHILGKLGTVKNSSIASKVSASLQEQSVQAWSLIRGCTARCPLCGSKCDCLGEHQKHSCSHHLFPAFHGWMDRSTGAPSLAFCKSEEVYSGTYQCRDNEWRTLAEYLDDSHPSWVPFPRGTSEFDEDVTVLRAAWVNCKVALEKYFVPMKATNPPQWECYLEPGRQLTIADLDAAKKTIRAIRNKAWVPEIPVVVKELVGGRREEATGKENTLLGM